MKTRSADEIYIDINTFSERVNTTCLPTHVFLFEKEKNIFWYDKEALSSRDRERGDALLLRNWIMLSTEHNIDIPNYAKTLRKSLKGRFIKKAKLHEAMSVLEACIETWLILQWKKTEQAKGYRNALPSIQTETREQSDKKIIEQIKSQVTKKKDQYAYWERISFFIRGAATNTVEETDIPINIPWTNIRIEKFSQKFQEIKTLEELLQLLPVIIPNLMGRRGRICKKIKTTEEKIIGLFPGTGADPWLCEKIEKLPLPSWAQLRDNVSQSIEPIKKIIQRKIKENIDGERLRGMKSGKIDCKRIMSAGIGSTNVFAQRKQKGNILYGISLLVDVSPSMMWKNPMLAAQPKIFGGLIENEQEKQQYDDYQNILIEGNPVQTQIYAKRIINGDTGVQNGETWHLAYRAAVILSMCFSGVEGIEFGITSFSDHEEIIKKIGPYMYENEKEKLMTALAHGGQKTVLDAALEMAEKELQKYTRKLIIVLTDGIFEGRNRNVKKLIEEITKNGTEVSILGLTNNAGKNNTIEGTFYQVNSEKELASAIKVSLEKVLQRNNY